MNEEKIELLVAGIVQFIRSTSDGYKLVASDWIIDLSNAYTMPGWNIGNQKYYPTLCFIQNISTDEKISKEVLRRIKIAFLNKQYLHAENIADEELRSRLLTEKAEKIKRIEESIEPINGQFLRCYYNHRGFMDGNMPSYDYLPLSI